MSDAHAAKSELDASEGWCCDGRTYKEHEHTDGKCCQPKGTTLDALPEDGRKAAQERMKREGSGGSGEPSGRPT
jgi:hypothetical protein